MRSDLGFPRFKISLLAEVSHDEAKMREGERPLPASDALFDEAADQISGRNFCLVVKDLCQPVSIKHGLRTADHGLRTGYKIRTRSGALTRYKMWTPD